MHLKRKTKLPTDPGQLGKAGEVKTYNVKDLNNPVKKTAAVGAKQDTTKLVTKPKKVVTTPASAASGNKSMKKFIDFDERPEGETIKNKTKGTSRKPFQPTRKPFDPKTGVTGVKKSRNLFPAAKKFAKDTPAVKQVKKDIAKRVATQTKTAQKKIIKKVATKAATRGVAKAGGKFLAKRIPGVGAIISGGEAIGRAAAGDYVGAALAGAEGIASFVPGLGTAASAGLGAIGAARDIRKATKAASTVKKVLKTTKGTKGAVAVKKAFRKTPKTNIKDLVKPTLKIPKGSTKAQTKRLEQIYGKTRLGRLTRQAVGAGTVTGIGKKAFKQVRGAVPNLDQGHVGRRTAG